MAMEIQHVNVKIFFSGELEVGLDRIVELFHRWTSEQSLPGLLIDVADYAHVPNGPGIVLVGHEADYAIDQADGQWGLLYNCKAPTDGTNPERLLAAFHAAAQACSTLEKELSAAGLPSFDRHRLQVTVNDRGLAPNTAETWERLEPDLRAFAEQLFDGPSVAMTPEDDPRRRFAVTMTSEQAFALPVAAS